MGSPNGHDDVASGGGVGKERVGERVPGREAFRRVHREESADEVARLGLEVREHELERSRGPAREDVGEVGQVGHSLPQRLRRRAEATVERNPGNEATRNKRKKERKVKEGGEWAR